MKSLMLVNDFVNDYLLTLPRIIGMSLIIIGIALALVTRRLARVIKKTDDTNVIAKTRSKIYFIAFLIIVAGMIVCVF